MSKIIWYQRRIVQNGGGERFCLSLVSENVCGGRVITTRYDNQVFDGDYSQHVEEIVSETYIHRLLKLRALLSTEYEAGNIIQTSGTWNHVIDIWLATLGTKVTYDCWIWGSMYQFPPSVEKLKYSLIFRPKKNDILTNNSQHRETYQDYNLPFIPFIKSNFLALLKYCAVRKSDRIYTLSKTNKDEIQLLYNREAIVDFAIYRETPTQLPLTSLPQAFPHITVFTVGRLAVNKNVDTMLYAFRQLLTSQPNAKFQIIGDGPERQRLEDLAIELGISTSVTFHGFVSDAELPRKIDPNSIFWCYDNADFNLAPLQFAAQGYTVVCAAPFQKNTFTEACANIHICERDIEELIATTIRAGAARTNNITKLALEFYTWKSLALRLTATRNKSKY